MKKPLLFLLAATLLASCASNTVSSSSVESSVPSSSSSSSADEEDHTEVPDLSDISSGIKISTSGFLSDISVGMSLATNSIYLINFTLTDNPTGKVKVYTDNTNVMSIETNESGTTYKIVTHKAGKSHLVIEDGDTIVHYRKLIEVKKKLTESEVRKLLVDVDHYGTKEEFVSYSGNLQIVFMEGEKGYMSGTESGGVTLNNESFTYEHDATYTSIAEDHDNWYIYRVSNWGETSFVFDYFAVWNTGDWIHAHTKNSLLAILVPQEEA